MNKLALCVGINDYPGTGNDLSGCVNDVKDWIDLLQLQHKFRVERLLNDEATCENIKSALSKMIGEAEPGDNVIFQFSGHGSFVPDEDGDESDGVDECLVPYDFSNGVLLDDDLYKIFSSKKPGVKAVFIADCCHSGTVCRMFSLVPSNTLRRIRFMSPAQFLDEEQIAHLGPRRRNFTKNMGSKLLMSKAPMLLMSGCQDTEYSYDAYFKGRPNGAFTRFMIDRIKACWSKHFTYRMLQQEVHKLLPNNEYPQTPNFVGTEEQFEWRVIA